MKGNKVKSFRFMGGVPTDIYNGIVDVFVTLENDDFEYWIYHYKKPDEDLIVTVNATNNEYISVRNATDFQLEKLEIDGII